MSINGIALTTGQIQRAHKIDLAFQSIIPLCQIVVYIYKIFYEFLRFHQNKFPILPNQNINSIAIISYNHSKISNIIENEIIL